MYMYFLVTVPFFFYKFMAVMKCNEVLCVCVCVCVCRNLPMVAKILPGNFHKDLLICLGGDIEYTDIQTKVKL